MTESDAGRADLATNQTAASDPRQPSTASLPLPLRSPEAFESYCSDVVRRLSDRSYEHRRFLQQADLRLTELSRAAAMAGDAALERQLLDYRSDVQALLRSFSAADSGRATAVVYHREAPQPVAEIANPGPLPELRSLAEIAELAAALRAEVQAWCGRHSLVSKNGEMNATACLELRAFACRFRQLREEAGAAEVPDVTRIGREILGIMASAGDREYTVALDEHLSPGPTAFQWGELAEHYMMLAGAMDAFLWWRANLTAAPPEEYGPFLEALGSVQQSFNRLLTRLNARDPFQQRIFDGLRYWARETPYYLHCLRPRAPLTELLHRASQLDQEWAALRSRIGAQGDQDSRGPEA